MACTVGKSLKARPCLGKGSERVAVGYSVRTTARKEGLIEVAAEAVLLGPIRAKVQWNVLERPILHAAIWSIPITPEPRVWVEDGDVGEVCLVCYFIPVSDVFQMLDRK